MASTRRYLLKVTRYLASNAYTFLVVLKIQCNLLYFNGFKLFSCLLFYRSLTQRRPQAAEAERVLAGELGAKKENLRRVIHP